MTPVTGLYTEASSLTATTCKRRHSLLATCYNNLSIFVYGVLVLGSIIMTDRDQS